MPDDLPTDLIDSFSQFLRQALNFLPFFSLKFLPWSPSLESGETTSPPTFYRGSEMLLNINKFEYLRQKDGLVFQV